MNDGVSVLVGGILIVGVLTICAIRGYSMGYSDAIAKTRREAVQANVGRFVADEHGRVKFEWVVTNDN